MTISETFRRDYHLFCASPLNSHDSIEKDLLALQSNKYVRGLAFREPHILMIGTAPVLISFLGIEYDIGDFIFFLIRKRVGRIWETDFRFLNVNNSVDDAYPNKIVVHPHVLQDEDNTYKLDPAVGRLCISKGRFAVCQDLRKAHINNAVTRLMLVLRTYDTGVPYFDVDEWPLLLREEFND